MTIHPVGPAGPVGRAHPILACADDLSAALEDVVDVRETFMTTQEKEAALRRLTEVADRLAALRLRVLAAADDVAHEHGARDAAAWLAHETNSTAPSSRRELRLALSLERHAAVADALTEGSIRTEQAAVICAAVDALPTEVDGRPLDADVRRRARDHLLELAADHDARALRRLGKRLLEVVAPEVGEAHEARLLEREENAAAAAASFSIVDDGHGRCHGRFTIPAHAGAMLRAHLMALASPRRHDPEDLRDDAGEWRSVPERLGSALVEYVERYPADRVPTAGGLGATVVVTVPYATLAGSDGAATLDTGERISPALARRLACEAGILPAVLGSRSQVLDLGRRTRLHTPAQRIALGLRDRGCTAQGCDLPPAACHAHHDSPWSRGGPTTLDNGRLLCPRHHRMAHRSDHEMRLHADNSVTFHRRT